MPTPTTHAEGRRECCETCAHWKPKKPRDLLGLCSLAGLKTKASNDWQCASWMGKCDLAGGNERSSNGSCNAWKALP